MEAIATKRTVVSYDILDMTSVVYMQSQFSKTQDNTASKLANFSFTEPESDDSTTDRGDRKLLVFELSHGGHYPAYIQHLMTYWCEQNLPGYLTFVVSPAFVNNHADIIHVSSAYGRENLNFVAITPDEQARLIPRKSPTHRVLRCLQEWQLVRKYTTSLKATHCLFLYFDTFQTAVALGLKLKCPFSGIYFRPTFHYPTFTHYAPDLKERVQHWREKLLLPKVIRHPQLEHLFCLDPFAIGPIAQLSHTKKAVYLPDPVEILGTFESHKLDRFKQNLGIAPRRKVFLLFGLLSDSRKGIHQLLDAISTLSPLLCEQLCLLLVGKMASPKESPLSKRITKISQSLPVQIIVRDEFIPDEEVPLYFQSADVVLAPYQRHVGMSGIVVQAAAAQKPLLSSDYGLMGETVRHWQLGLTVDSTVPAEIAKGLTQFLLESPKVFYDKNQMRLLAEQNSSEQFAKTIFQKI